MRILIVGAGAIGGLFGFFLVKSGQQVLMLERSQETAERINRKGLMVRGMSGRDRVKVRVNPSPSEAGDIDLVLLCVKSYDTTHALSKIKVYLKRSTLVLTIQNGLGNLEKVAKIVGIEHTLGGITAQGATELGPGKILHAGSGETIIGALAKKQMKNVEEIANVFNKAGIKTSITNDLQGTIWSKLIINAGINPLTSLLRVKNGELLKYKELREIMRDTIKEAVLIAKAKGIRLKWKNPVVQAEKVCQATAENYSSMLQDIINHKRTEIDYINGAIVREGKKNGIQTPFNSVLTKLIKYYEKVTEKSSDS